MNQQELNEMRERILAEVSEIRQRLQSLEALLLQMEFTEDEKEASEQSPTEMNEEEAVVHAMMEEDIVPVLRVEKIIPVPVLSPEPPAKEELPEVPQKKEAEQPRSPQPELPESNSENEQMPPKVAGKPILNEKLAKLKTKPNSAELFEGSPIQDLNKAITLNQKLAFIKLLFGGDGEIYKSAIDFSNNCGNSNDAIEHVNQYIKNKDLEEYHHLTQYIKRRWS